MSKFSIKQPFGRRQRKIHRWFGTLIRLMFFIYYPSAFTAAFMGVKYIFTCLGSGVQIEWISFVRVLMGICLFTVLFGRFFCGYACAFGSFGDAVHGSYLWICKKLKKKPVRIMEKQARFMEFIKYAVLAGIAVLCFGGIYEKVQGTSPWDVFSLICAGNFNIGGYITGTVLLVVVIAGMCIQARFFCRFLCPMGAVFSLLPVLPVFSLHRDRAACIKGCSGCTKKCPSDIELPAAGSWAVSGECFSCGKCIDVCPKENITCGIRCVRGNEAWFILFCAVLLLCLYRVAGI